MGSVQTVLIEGTSRRNSEQLTGRADSNRRVVFAAEKRVPLQKGDYAKVRIERSTGLTLQGSVVGKTQL